MQKSFKCHLSERNTIVELPIQKVLSFIESLSGTWREIRRIMNCKLVMCTVKSPTWPLRTRIIFPLSFLLMTRSNVSAEFVVKNMLEKFICYSILATGPLYGGYNLRMNLCHLGEKWCKILSGACVLSNKVHTKIKEGRTRVTILKDQARVIAGIFGLHNCSSQVVITGYQQLTGKAALSFLFCTNGLSKWASEDLGHFTTRDRIVGCTGIFSGKQQRVLSRQRVAFAVLVQELIAAPFILRFSFGVDDRLASRLARASPTDLIVELIIIVSGSEAVSGTE